MNDLKYPFIRYKFVGDEIVEIKYLSKSPINPENYSLREDGGITSNYSLGSKTKEELIQIKLEQLKATYRSRFKGLRKISKQIKELNFMLENKKPVDM